MSWRFVDPLIDETLARRRLVAPLDQAERDAIARRFWEVGRLTLEHWLAPRLERAPLHVHENAHVITRTSFSDGDDAQRRPRGARDRLQGGPARVPYLRELAIETRDGFPVLDAHMQTSVPGLYVPGFAATQDFGPFFGFVRRAGRRGSDLPEYRLTM